MKSYCHVFKIFLALGVLSATCVAEIPTAPPRLLHVEANGTATLSMNGQDISVRVGERAGSWTLMNLEGTGTSAGAVLEDFSDLRGHVLAIDKNGVKFDLPKSAEETTNDPAKLYLGHTLQQVMDSAHDLLGAEILKKAGDPSYDEVASVFPTVRNMKTYSFVGTQQSIDKVGFEYGGRSPDFDPAPYDAAIPKIREAGKVMDGLVGGYLPILRFVFPEEEGAWTEMLTLAPFRITNGNNRIQPVWYRVVHVQHGMVKWARYVDSYHPFPGGQPYDARGFYRDLEELRTGWNAALASGIQIDLPDKRMENMARFALVREMMTRVGDFPKYGVVDRDYAGSEHDGFPDTFTVDTTAMLNWGLVDVAGRYIDNYFGEFVRDDGSLLYRGPETGQYGHMLYVVAQFVNYGGDRSIVLKRRSRIDGVTNLLLVLREKAKRLPRSDPAYGMISGWSEADSCLDAHPDRYIQPYFSNSLEAARGFHDLGLAWIKIGTERKNPELVTHGEALVRESKELQSDIQQSIAKSLLKADGEPVLPSIAGVKEPFHVAVARDTTDPQFRSYRAYMEMMESGLLTPAQAEMVVKYREGHHDILLGVPTAYGYKTGDLAGFLAYGHGYGLIQHDMVESALLLTYSTMAHQYTRGTWMAPETRPVFNDSPAAPYCTPAQLVVALMARWMLVFEDPVSDTLWLGKAAPRSWFEDGERISISRVPTRWGKVDFATESQVANGKIVTSLDLPVNGPRAIKLRLRAPGKATMHSVTVNGKAWLDFDPEKEMITLPPSTTGKVAVIANY